MDCEPQGIGSGSAAESLPHLHFQHPRLDFIVDINENSMDFSLEGLTSCDADVGSHVVGEGEGQLGRNEAQRDLISVVRK